MIRYSMCTGTAGKGCAVGRITPSISHRCSGDHCEAWVPATWTAHLRTITEIASKRPDRGPGHTGC
jgi:hypothetical protein